MNYVENVRPRLRVPATAAPGEVVEIKTLLSHPMESGHRLDADGRPIPRLIVQTMVATFDGAEVFRAEWGPGVAANPYQAFMLRIEAAGDLEVVWSDEAGNAWRDGARIELA